MNSICLCLMTQIPEHLDLSQPARCLEEVLSSARNRNCDLIVNNRTRRLHVRAFVVPQDCLIFLVVSEAQNRTQQQSGTVCDIFLPVLTLEKLMYF